MAAYERLKGAGITPDVLGVRYEANAAPKTVSPGLGGHVQARRGELAMGVGAGKPLGKLSDSDKLEIEKREGGRFSEIVGDKFLNMRRILHERGIAHNDMHAYNVMYDPKTGKILAAPLPERAAAPP